MYASTDRVAGQHHGTAIIKDVANFTDIEPVFQISEVVVPLEDQDYSRR